MVLGPALAVASYLLGSISFGLLAARRAGVDLRAEGSGNVGATNVGRVLGKRTGRVVLLLDAAKGAIPSGLAWWLLGPDDPWTAATGALAVLGHCAPIWHAFRGGKGAATAAGVMLVLVWPAGLAAVVSYAALKKLTRRASVGSIVGAVLGAAIALAWLGPGPRAWMTVAIAVIVLVRHAGNLRRLLRGEEPPS
ncbi:MAG: glycerol-3-phosphate 1-O-acyltransferase PlsY [Sandaracinaceae bacterium]